MKSPSALRSIPTPAGPLPAHAICIVSTALLWWLAGQKSGLFALGWIALTPLLWMLHGLSPRARWRLGYLSGVVSFILINWWIAPTIAKGSPMIGLPTAAGAVLGIIAVLFIAAIHGLMVALVALTWDTTGRLAQRAPWALPLIVACLWAVLDALRSETALAHIWGALAYTQWRDTALLQTAALVGQHGLTALCVWFAASLALWLRCDAATAPAYLWRAPLLVFALLHVWGAWRLRQPLQAQDELRVLLVQTAVPSLRKNNLQPGPSPAQQASALTMQYFAQPERAPIDVIVWPETTVEIGPFPSSRATPRTAAGHELVLLSNRLSTPLLTGARHWTKDGRLFNDAVLITPDGGISASSKLRTVPFGERAPYGEYWPFLRRFAPNPEVVPASQVKPLNLSLRGTPAAL
ncbi:MAG TPA: apolipoprotein N-acyltransferase, partial [Abditibacteriaceae bacterium]|nr:apolipoprotein N-acyltransferase [Abditibacteriaceae bacterium]